MKRNGLAFAVAGLAALCLVYGGVSRYMDQSEKKAEQKEEAAKVYMTDISDISAVSYDYQGQKLSFTKKDGTWKYDGDDLFPVKQEKLEALATTVSKLEALRKLEGGDSLASYGLDTPAKTVEAAGEDGTKTEILLGTAAGDGDYYAMVQGEDIPYLISSSLFSETDIGLEALQALEEFPAIAGTDITGIAIKKDGTSQNYVKKTLDDEAKTVEWYRDSSDSPDNKLSDNSALNVLADSLSSLKVKSCSNYKVQEGELAGYGLDDPTAIITYTYEKNGSEENFTLSIGSLNEDSSAYYTRTEDSPNVNEIDKASIDKCLTVDKGV